MLTYILIGALIGVVLGLTGAGGGIFAIPLLVFFAELDMQVAAPIALFAVTVGAAVGAVSGLKEKIVRYRAAVVIALAGLPTSWLGVQLAERLSSNSIVLLFVAVMLWVAYTQIRKKPATSQTKATLICINPDTQRIIWTPLTSLILLLLGLGVGLVTGLLGVGGGFIIVPLLRKLTPISMRSATATSLMIITLVSGQTILSHLSQGKVLPLPKTLIFTAMTVLGMWLARRYSKYIPERGLQIVFGVMLILISILMAFPILDSLW